MEQLRHDVSCEISIVICELLRENKRDIHISSYGDVDLNSVDVIAIRVQFYTSKEAFLIFYTS